ncbi:hypothetical protein Tco_0682695 [Tanacetum coccineum]|uniref:Reverse transcriptase domain-containing protein n=1 Tax=Tanacetum coccineum TaxID=301880 RepID=A0ABQ4XRW9_9ASTR
MIGYDEEKTRFHTEEGVYCFTHMPKELKNSAATLQRMMEEVLADQRGRNMEIYLEEIVIKSKCELDLVQDVEETLRKLKRVNIKIDPVTSSFGVKKGRFLGFMVTKEGVRADPEKTYDISYIPRREAEGSVVKKFFGQGEQVEETPNANEGGTLNLSRKLQAKSTPTPRAWRLYLGREIIEEGSGVGIILVSPDEKIYSFAIRLKFNVSNHAMDYEALLIGLAVSVSKGLATIKLEFLNQEVSMGIKTRPPIEETSSSKKGKAASNVPCAKPNYNWEASGSN